MPSSPRLEQAAAIPVKDGQICLITSRSGKRWVIPKGRLERGKTAEEIAREEAWEEAGVFGILHPQPVGSYVYVKWGGTYHVTVFFMEVTEVADEWPERSLRRRCWLKPAQCLVRIHNSGLREIIRNTLALAPVRKDEG